jgi:hypothetical protein
MHELGCRRRWSAGIGDGKDLGEGKQEHLFFTRDRLGWAARFA